MRRVRSEPGSRLGYALAWATLALPPLVFDQVARESFRFPKLMASEVLALAALLALSLQPQHATGLEAWRSPVVRAVAPFVLVATLSLATTAHPAHARDAVFDLWIGAACLMGWSLWLPARRLLDLLRFLIWPAALLALLAVLQQLDLFEPWKNMAHHRARNAISLAGSVGDLGLYLVLPILTEASLLGEGRAPHSRLRWAALVVCVAGLAVSQTLTAIVAVAAGVLVLAPRRRPSRRTLTVVAAAIALSGLLVQVAAPRAWRRFRDKIEQARERDWNQVLSGRLDSWQAAAAMLGARPLAGVGFGAYAAEYLPMKLELDAARAEPRPVVEDRGFDNAHNEYLGVAAELGVPGLIALAWSIALAARAGVRRGGPDSGGRGEGEREHRLAMAGLCAIAVTALAWFPFRIALTAYPMILFLAWIFRRDAEAGS